MPDLAPQGDSDLYFVPVADPQAPVARILELAKIRILKPFGLDSIRDVHRIPILKGNVANQPSSPPIERS
jgi:hypothetical protein